MQPGYPPPPPGYGWAPGPAGYYPPQRTNTPRTLGLLSIIFGALVVVNSLIALVAGKQFGTMAVQESQREAFGRYLAEVHDYTMATSVVMLLMAGALIAIGIGQRGYKRWAVKASVLWGMAGLAVVVAQAIGAFTVVLPALDRFTTEITSNVGLDSGAFVAGAKIGAFLGIAFYVPYPLILILSFRKPHIVAAMDEPKAPPAAA